MKWFEQAMASGAQRARFADVTPAQRRVPSWLPGRSSPERRHDAASLRPPKLPAEFVDAVRQELDHEYAARARASLPPGSEAMLRRSERPPPSRRQGAPPPSEAASIAALAPAPAAVAVPEPALVEAFENAVALLGLERERLLSETAGQVAELAALIARRVIARELSLDPTLVRQLVKEGIDALGQHDRVLVRVGKAFACAQPAIAEDLRRQGSRFEVLVDEAVGDYGCMVETDLGQVDESVESRLETLLQALTPDTTT